MKKLITAAVVALTFAGTAVADPIYIDVGVDNGGNANDAAGPTTTGWKNLLQLKYSSNSDVTDVNNNGIIDAGDTIISEGGLIPGASVTDNLVTALIADQFGGGPSDNGFKSAGAWGLSFRFDDLMGTFNGTDFIYTSGTIEWLLMLDPANDQSFTQEVRLFDMSIVGHNSMPGNQNYFGEIGNFGVGQVNGVDIGDVFNIQYGNSSMSFEDYAANFSQNVRFNINQNTVTSPGDFSYNAQTGKFEIRNASHNAQATFAVPEPASIAMLGLGLLGFAGASRRKSK
jgi:hypothetical protein